MSKSLSAARLLLERCEAHGHKSVTPMQLIKLAYIAHGYMLGRHGSPLLDEEVEAWQYGPVVPTLYHAVKAFKSNPINAVPGAVDFAFSNEEKAVIDGVANIYGRYNGIVLSAATHKPGTPWHQTWSTFGKNAPISNDLIESFYSELLKQEKHSSL
ncbi:MAG TPA: type II toxin-antitoxin system antitoxin SocA domain-containing protein [Burkholderiales bacterium]|nr:type II toxin-antitoxin system antitoxin SocA domain-containing protein [Burkholderiales bacterium]